MKTRGRYICDTLKGIRKQIADANEIVYEPRLCTHEGECQGTCPACEAEVRYLEHELDLRRQLGKAVAVVGIAAGMSALTAGCNPRIFNPPLAGIPEMPPEQVDSQQATTEGCNINDSTYELEGDVVAPMPETQE